MTNLPDSAMTIAEVEQATGLSREVLRKWELRYQFPLPMRGARGQRQYARDDAHKLQLIAQLLAQGLRPSNLVRLSLAELQQRHASSTAHVLRTNVSSQVLGLIACLKVAQSASALQEFLLNLIDEVGVSRFIEEHFPAFNVAIGEAWVAGVISIASEHHYTETLRSVVIVRLAALPKLPPQGRIILCTPPGELHALGLLGLQVKLSLVGAECINLGTQMPAADVALAALDWRVTVVAIYASCAFGREPLQVYVCKLRQLLPTPCDIWLGGRGAENLQLENDDIAASGLRVFNSLEQAAQAWALLMTEQTETKLVAQRAY